ncbi:MAG: DUF131 domain-containing protein [Theionarchaea archaeon]|nr:DUF131 domain-containing protein [Theionarchaea archaeon]
MLLIFVGTVVVMVGVLHSFYQVKEGDTEGNVRAGGIILIGPIPIVFGTDKTMVLLSIAGAVLLLSAFLVWRRG